MQILAFSLLRIFTLSLTLSSLALAVPAATQNHTTDPHYVAPGFFDLHVCHWPDQPLFFMAIFSSTHFADVATVEVRDANNKYLGMIDLTQFEIKKTPQGQEKHIYITHFDVPPNAPDGWYTANIKLRSGQLVTARDFVRVRMMDLPSGFLPADNMRLIDAPGELQWNAIPGAHYYQVTIRNAWSDEKPLYRSALLKAPRLTLPHGLLHRGESYTWRVHARDVNEDKKLGDFNAGTLGPVLSFTIEP